MRIASLGTRGIPARYGGFETFAQKLAAGLFARGFDVTVFCESGKSSAPDVFQGVKLRYVSAPSLGPLQTILYDLRCLWAARRGYDVVYMLGYGAAPFCLIPRLWGTANGACAALRPNDCVLPADTPRVTQPSGPKIGLGPETSGRTMNTSTR